MLWRLAQNLVSKLNRNSINVKWLQLLYLFVTRFCVKFQMGFIVVFLNARPLLSITFPQAFRISKNIGHAASGSGGKRPLNGTSKVKKWEKKKLFFAQQFSTIFKQKYLYLRPLLSNTFPQGFRISKNIWYPTSGNGGKKTVKKDRKPKKIEKKWKKWRKKTFFCDAIFNNLKKNVHIWDHFFPLLFPKDFESLKILDIRLWEVGAKIPLNGTSKVNKQTDTQTDVQTDISTYRKHRPRGQMLWKPTKPTKPNLLNKNYQIKHTKLNQTKHT